MLHYAITARRIDARGSISGVRDAQVSLDTSLEGRDDALNPVELLLSALAACMIKGVERAAPMLGFDFSGVEVRIEAERQDSPPPGLQQTGGRSDDREPRRHGRQIPCRAGQSLSHGPA